MRQLGSLSHEAKLKALYDGKELLNGCRLEEAHMVASELVASLPEDSECLAFKGDVLEAMGKYEAALVCYGKVLELNPSSRLDQVRYDQISRKLEQDDLVLDEPRRRNVNKLAVACGLAMTVFAVAGILALRNQPATNPNVASNTPNYYSKPFEPPIDIPVYEGDPSTRTAVTGGGTGTAETNSAATNEPRTYAGTQNPGPSTNERPFTNSAAGIGDEGFRPFDVGGPPVVVPSNQGTIPGNDAGPPTEDDDPVDSTSNEPPRRNPGTVQIGPAGSAGSPNGVGNSDVVATNNAANDVNALVRQARDAYLRSQFSQAANLYERALQLGASVASTNHRLALCYEKLGNRSKAIGCYERALSAYQSQSGGNVEARNAAIEQCKSALKSLRG